MDFFHYTHIKNLPLIEQKGLLPLCTDQSTLLINECLEQEAEQYPILLARKKAIFFYTIPQYEEEEEMSPDLIELSIEFKDLDTNHLYVANWSYAEEIYLHLKQKNIDTEVIDYYKERYLQSIRQMTSIEDMSLYEQAECFYTKEIPFRYLRAV